MRPKGLTSTLPQKSPLSDMDHIMPKIYILIVEIFELSASTSKDIVVTSLVEGLEFSLDQYPEIAGCLEMDEKTGQMCKSIWLFTGGVPTT